MAAVVCQECFLACLFKQKGVCVTAPWFINSLWPHMCVGLDNPCMTLNTLQGHGFSDSILFSSSSVFEDWWLTHHYLFFGNPLMLYFYWCIWMTLSSEDIAWRTIWWSSLLSRKGVSYEGSWVLTLFSWHWSSFMSSRGFAKLVEVHPYGQYLYYISDRAPLFSMHTLSIWRLISILFVNVLPVSNSSFDLLALMIKLWTFLPRVSLLHASSHFGLSSMFVTSHCVCRATIYIIIVWLLQSPGFMYYNSVILCFHIRL